MARVLVHLILLTIFLHFVAGQRSKDPAACGLFNVLSVDGNRTKCGCPRGFSLLHPKDPNGDCKPDFTPTCDEGVPAAADMFDFIELTDIDWPGNDYFHMDPSNEQICKNMCLDDCFCGVAIFRSNQCWKKCFPLSNGKVDTSLKVKAFVKFQKGKRPPTCPP